MKSIQTSLSHYHKTLWFLLVNILLIGFSVYVHALLYQLGYAHENPIVENIEIWMLILFKMVGANLILAVIFSEFKNNQS